MGCCEPVAVRRACARPSSSFPTARPQAGRGCLSASRWSPGGRAGPRIAGPPARSLPTCRACPNAGPLPGLNAAALPRPAPLHRCPAPRSRRSPGPATVNAGRKRAMSGLLAPAHQCSNAPGHPQVVARVSFVANVKRARRGTVWGRHTTHTTHTTGALYIRHNRHPSLKSFSLSSSSPPSPKGRVSNVPCCVFPLRRGVGCVGCVG